MMYVTQHYSKSHVLLSEVFAVYSFEASAKCQNIRGVLSDVLVFWDKTCYTYSDNKCLCGRNLRIV